MWERTPYKGPRAHRRHRQRSSNLRDDASRPTAVGYTSADKGYYRAGGGGAGTKIKKIVPNKLYLVLVFHPKRLILHLIGGAATKSSATSHVWGLPRAER
jgi:hypothetical protein